MTRTEGFNLHLNKSETRLLCDIVHQWLEDNENAEDILYDMAADIATELFQRWTS